MKLEKMKNPVAGHYIPIKHAAEIYDAAKNSDVSDDFINGTLFALGFLTIPEDEDMHGATPEQFLDNYLKNKEKFGDIPSEVLAAIAELIEDLESQGANVTEAILVKVDE